MIFIISFSTLLIALYGFMILSFWRGWRNRQVIISKDGLSNSFVSVVVPFRNEEANLSNLLEALSLQSYSDDQFEVILINDHSEDGSVALIEAFKAKSVMNITLLNTSKQGKKRALEMGINQARGNVIIQTDADCQMQSGWIESMVASFKTSSAVVLGPVNMVPQAGFWSAFAALDFMSLQGSGTALALLGKPIMGSAANMAFTRELWQQSRHQGASRDSGDDVFLIQAAKKTGARIEVCVSPQSIVLTEAPASFNEMLKQRSRWGAKTPSYQSALAKSIALLVAAYAVWCVTLLAYGLFSQPVLQLFVFTMGIKALLDYYFLRAYSKATGQQGLMKIFPSAALVYPFYIVVTLFTMLFGKQQWKGRAIR